MPTVDQASQAQADRLCRLFCNAVYETIAGAALRDAADEIITPAQFAGLEFIHQHPGGCIKDLAEGLQVSHPAAVKLVERLVARDLVARRVSEADRRVVQLRPTATGLRLLKTVQERRVRLTEAVLAQMTGHRQVLLDAIGDFVRSAAALQEGHQLRVCLRCGTAHSEECPLAGTIPA